MRQLFSLNDDHWRVGSVTQKPFGAVNDFAEVDEWLPAMVPGDVRLDLLRAGKISDPFYGTNNEASQWVDTRDWWYVRDVELSLDKGARSFFIFDGIDYQSAVFWNGVELGPHVGMFSRQVYEIPHAEHGQLAVRVWGAEASPRLKLNRAKRFIQSISPRVLPTNPAFAERLATLKCQMSFGWDFAPRLRTCGIWDDVWLVQTRVLFIRDVWIQGVPDGRVRVRISVDVLEACAIQARVNVHGKNFSCDAQVFDFRFDVSTGQHQGEFQFQLDTPRLWNPWDRGAPNLYELELTLRDGISALDTVTETFGLRTIDLAPNLNSPASKPPWTFIVNGVPEFIRGANWVPADAIPARVMRDDYAALIQLARGANINLLRVWGGGVREKCAFYDLCDELGILVWQEFPFSGAPGDHLCRDRAFLAFAHDECSAIVRALRNHPSLALWCGGNEFNTTLNAPLVKTLRRTVAEFDGTRPFKSGSPSHGERHNWRVWHGRANTRDYRNDDAGFYGEFGLQALPNIETLARFMPADELWPPGAMWIYHNAELEKLWRYARAIRPQINSLDEFVHASQTAQLRGLQVMIEHARRRKGRVGGVAFWQFNEPWPAISWSVVDYARKPKAAYFKIKELYNPVLISFDYPLVLHVAGDNVTGELWLINDALHVVQGELRVFFNEAHVFSEHAEIGATGVARISALQVVLADGANVLRLELIKEGAVISTNEYDLNYCDRGEIGWLYGYLEEISARLKS